MPLTLAIQVLILTNERFYCNLIITGMIDFNIDLSYTSYLFNGTTSTLTLHDLLR